MASDAVQPLGPLFGPDYLLLEVNDATKVTYSLQVYPDANNPALQANGLATHFYYLPQQLYLAKRPDSPTDFDFSVTLFKGLMTTEDTLGISNMPSSGGEVDAGGAFVTFSMTMAVPPSVVTAALAQLKSQSHAAPPARIASYFNNSTSGPAPVLGVVPIQSNDVSIEVPQLPGSPAAAPETPAPAPAPATGTTAAPAPPPPPGPVNTGDPWFISAQGAGKGSIDASGISSFLVTCNQMAAGAIVGSLKAGQSPFKVHYNLTALFYLADCNIHMHVDFDKVFLQLSAAAEVKYTFVQADLSANYQSCMSSGAITTVISLNGAVPDPDLKTFIDQQSAEMQTEAWNMVKTEMFNWQPTPEAPATASTSACGGAAVSLKANYQQQGGSFDDTLIINSTTSLLDGVDGTLTEIEPAIKANLNKYLAIVDIGEFFQKIQVAASTSFTFGSDPISQAMIEVSYPDFDSPTGANGAINLKTLGQGFHYTPGTPVNQSAPVTLASWSSTNPTDIINISFMRLQNDLPNWPANQVTIKKTLVYNPDDPRVDLSNGTTTISTTSTGIDHTPVVGPEDIGYVYIGFFLDRPLSAPNITVTLTIQIGSRSDVLVMTQANPSPVWQVWSDKYFNETTAKVTIDVEVAPPASNFAGTPVQWSGSQAVPLALGLIKKIPACKIELPALTDTTQQDLVAQYITQTLMEMGGY